MSPDTSAARNPGNAPPRRRPERLSDARRRRQILRAYRDRIARPQAAEPPASTPLPEPERPAIARVAA